MSNPRLVAFILILVLVAGCARWKRHDPDRPEDWIGLSERELVLAVGAPDSVHELDKGGRILTWRRRRIEQSGGEIYTTSETRTIDGQPVVVPVTRQQPTVEVRHKCTASFEFNDDALVIEQKIQGNDCGDFLR